MDLARLNEVYDCSKYVGELLTVSDLIYLMVSGRLLVTEGILSRKEAYRFLGPPTWNGDFFDLGVYKGLVVTNDPYDFEEGKRIILNRDWDETILGYDWEPTIKEDFINFITHN